MFIKPVCLAVILSFFLTSLSLPNVRADGLSGLPAAGTMVNPSPAYLPVLIKGLKVHPENPLLFDFILDTGKSGLKPDSQAFKSEVQKLIKYFLASLTIKEEDLWVNLSPYEHDRMITDELGQTLLGRDMLAEDYILKQLTASLIYPEKELGKEFWNRVYSKARQVLGTSDIPIDTFNKVWIVADKAKVLERDNGGYVIGAHLKVMLEEDYFAMEKNRRQAGDMALAVSPSTLPSGSGLNLKAPQGNYPTHLIKAPQRTHFIASPILRDIVIPQLTQEVNEGKNFAPVRQMFYAMILSTWYKRALKEALLNRVYSNKAKINGVLSDDLMAKEKIYQQYLKAYKKGVFNYIKEGAADAVGGTPKRYFSGGIGADFAMAKVLDITDISDVHQLFDLLTRNRIWSQDSGEFIEARVEMEGLPDDPFTNIQYLLNEHVEKVNEGMPQLSMEMVLIKHVMRIYFLPEANETLFQFLDKSTGKIIFYETLTGNAVYLPWDEIKRKLYAQALIQNQTRKIDAAMAQPRTAEDIVRSALNSAVSKLNGLKPLSKTQISSPELLEMRSQVNQIARILALAKGTVGEDLQKMRKASAVEYSTYRGEVKTISFIFNEELTKIIALNRSSHFWGEYIAAVPALSKKELVKLSLAVNGYFVKDQDILGHIMAAPKGGEQETMKNRYLTPDAGYGATLGKVSRLLSPDFFVKDMDMPELLVQELQGYIVEKMKNKKNYATLPGGFVVPLFQVIAEAHDNWANEQGYDVTRLDVMIEDMSAGRIRSLSGPSMSQIPGSLFAKIQQGDQWIFKQLSKKEQASWAKSVIEVAAKASDKAMTVWIPWQTQQAVLDVLEQYTHRPVNAALLQEELSKTEGLPIVSIEEGMEGIGENPLVLERGEGLHYIPREGIEANKNIMIYKITLRNGWQFLAGVFRGSAIDIANEVFQAAKQLSSAKVLLSAGWVLGPIARGALGLSRDDVARLKQEIPVALEIEPQPDKDGLIFFKLANGRKKSVPMLKESDKNWGTVLKRYPHLQQRELMKLSIAARGYLVEDENFKETQADNAMAVASKKPGGIDFNAGNMELKIAKEGGPIEMRLDPAVVAEFQKGNFSGVAGIILRIVPIQNPMTQILKGQSV